MQALILAGGLGTRLGDFVKDDPKPFLTVDGNPFILKIVERLIQQNVTDIVFCLGYKANKIFDYFGDGSTWNVNISYVIENSLKGTAGAIRGALHKITHSDVVVVNGDSFCFFDLKGLMACHYLHNAAATLSVLQADDPERYGIVEFNEQGRIKSFVEKGKIQSQTAYINAGVYILNKSIILEIDSERPVSLEKEIFPANLDKKMYAFRLNDNRFIDIGTPESLILANTFFKD